MSTQSRNAAERIARQSQLGETTARREALPVSQGTNSVRGTWCSEGKAGCHHRSKVVTHGTPSPLPLSPPIGSNRNDSSVVADGVVWRGLLGVAGNLIVWKRAIPRNRMRESLTYGSVGGLIG